jgi:esterase/lipase superfamily enzyme
MIHHARDTVIFVHGYNVSFRQALTSAAQLKRNFSTIKGGPGVNVVLFSWPSDGSMMPYIAYGNDRQDAQASGPGFARGLLKVADFLRGSSAEEACDQRLHLVAHSMGNYVLRHTVQEYVKQSSGRPARIFDQVLLMAADEDDDTFEYDHKMKPLPRLAKRVNVYFNNEDRAMAVSDKTKGNPDRLGDDGPRVPRSIPGKVALIDTTQVVAGLVEHSYFLDTPRVVADMQKVLVGTPTNKIPGREYVPDTNRYRLL